MGVIPLPGSRIRQRIACAWEGCQRLLTSSDGDSVRKLVGLILVLHDGTLEGQGLTRLQVGNVLGHFSSLSKIYERVSVTVKLI